MIAHIIWVMFQWPQGIVVGNLIASAITSVLVYLKLHARMNKQHAALHARLDKQHKEHLAAIRKRQR